MMCSSKIVVILCCAFISSGALADALDDCIDQKVADFSDPNIFTKQGSVSCPAGDIVGFPPRARKHNRTGVVTFTAPDGFVIRNDNVSAIEVIPGGSINGTYQPAQVSSDGRSVSVAISCNGKSPGQGRAGQEITIRGTIERVPAVLQMKKWFRECAKSI